MLEEDVAVFSRAAENRVLGVECARTECGDGVLIDHFLQVVVVPRLDLLYLVRGAEAVEEVDERNSSLDGGKVSDRAEVHDLLRVGSGDHCKAGLAAGINVGMVTEDVERMGSHAARRNVDNAGQKLSGDLVHIRDHEEKSLGCREGGGQCAGCKASVNRACGTRLGLHFDDLYGVAENVLHPGRRPGVGQLCHNAGRRDGVDGGNFRKRIGNVCGGGVTVHRDLFSCHFISSGM